jgi:hypothetical protein
MAYHRNTSRPRLDCPVCGVSQLHSTIRTHAGSTRCIATAARKGPLSVRALEIIEARAVFEAVIFHPRK